MHNLLREEWDSVCVYILLWGLSGWNGGPLAGELSLLYLVSKQVSLLPSLLQGVLAQPGTPSHYLSNSRPAAWLVCSCLHSPLFCVSKALEQCPWVPLTLEVWAGVKVRLHHTSHSLELQTETDKQMMGPSQKWSKEKGLSYFHVFFCLF